MAIGGGTWETQNKILPGMYANFVSLARATAARSDRGIATVPMQLDWGALGEVTEADGSDFQRSSMTLFGYDFTAPEMRNLRELYKNIRLGYIYRMGTGGTKATCAYATAKHAGIRGNDLMVIIAENPDDSSTKDVMLKLGDTVVSTQTVSGAAALVDNDFVVWDKEESLSNTAGTPLTGGVNPTVTNADYQAYLDVIEGYNFHAIGCPSDETAVKGLFAAFTKRMRDERGVKFQLVSYNNPADHEGVVDLLNKVVDEGVPEYSAIYWVTGVIAGTAVNASAQNNIYDGEYTLDIKHTQRQLEAAMASGQFAFHRVGRNEIRVLDDINSFISFTAEKSKDFGKNQTVRVIDQIANDVAVLFRTKYLGAIPNDPDGRVSLWVDIVKIHTDLQTKRAITGFVSDDITVEPGDGKDAVLADALIQIVNAMSKLYLRVTVA